MSVITAVILIILIKLIYTILKNRRGDCMYFKYRNLKITAAVADYNWTNIIDGWRYTR